MFVRSVAKKCVGSCCHQVNYSNRKRFKINFYNRIMSTRLCCFCSPIVRKFASPHKTNCILLQSKRSSKRPRRYLKLKYLISLISIRTFTTKFVVVFQIYINNIIFLTLNHHSSYFFFYHFTFSTNCHTQKLKEKLDQSSKTNYVDRNLKAGVAP